MNLPGFQLLHPTTVKEALLMMNKVDARTLPIEQLFTGDGARPVAAKSMEAVDKLIVPSPYRRRAIAIMAKSALEHALRNLGEGHHAS